MDVDHRSLSKPQYEDRVGAVFVRDQEESQEVKEHFVVQIVERAKEEWEVFHLEHPAIDEEVFYETQCFCVKQWVLQKGIRLADLSTFGQARKHFEGEIQLRAAQLQANSVAMEYVYQEAQSLCSDIAKQARWRSSQAREAIKTLDSKKIPGVVGKIKQAYALGQAQDRARAAEESVQWLQQCIDMMKSLGIVREYEKQKKYMEEYKKDIVHQYKHIDEIMRKMHYQFSKNEILDHAINGIKRMIKDTINAVKREKDAKKAACQTARMLEQAGGEDLEQCIASEQEVLLLAASANDVVGKSTVSYRVFHKLATEMAKGHLQIDKQRLKASLEVLTTYLDQIKQEKERKQGQCQRATSVIPQSQAHLLIDEQTGLITLNDRVTAFHMQDLIGIAQTNPQETLGHSRLLFQDAHPCSSYDVCHDLLHETSEPRTRIHLQVSDGAGGQVAMLYLPNGTGINIADIDLDQTEHDPVRPERGVTITLKQDGRKINLLAAASVMSGDLKQEALCELLDKTLDDSLDRISYALTTQNLDEIEDAFRWAKEDDRERKYLDRYLFSSQDRKKRAEDFIAWTEHVTRSTEQAVHTLHRYADETLKGEIGAKEIIMTTVLENIVSNGSPSLLFQQREACLKEISKGRCRDTVISCQLLDSPDDPSTVTNLSPNGQEMLLEYERAKTGQLAAQWQDSPASRSAEKWTAYLARLHCAILDEAPAYYRTQFLVQCIREALENDHWEQGTEDDPGVARLATQLARGVSAIGKQSPQASNEYARAIDLLTQSMASGVRGAVKTANPSEIVSRVDFLAIVFAVIDCAEILVENALSPTTPTALARAMVQQISGVPKHQEK